MQTRTKLWANYRLEITNNVNLPKLLSESSETLKILKKRLMTVFPAYNSQYNHEAKLVYPKLDSYTPKQVFNADRFHALCEQIQALDLTPNLTQIKNVDFSSHAFDAIINNIRAHRSNRVLLNISAHEEALTLNKSKIVQLDQRSKVKKTSLKPLNIAIDGPSGSGKSTIARLVAQKYHLTYINTGLVYRAIAFFCQQHQISFQDPQTIIQVLPKIKIKLLANEEVELNNTLITKELRADSVSQGASKVSTILEVRKMAVALQKTYAQKKGVIMEGRDTTFVVMPQADIKIYLDTKAETRAQRRAEQNQKLGFNSNYAEILAEIKERDDRDQTRTVDPLHIVPDAIYLDASNLSVAAVMQEIGQIIDQYQAQEV